MSNVTHINFHYKGAHVHCESDCGAPDTESAVEAVDKALTAAGLATFEQLYAVGGTAEAQCSDEANAAPDTDDSQLGLDTQANAAEEDAAEEEAKAKADAKKKADAEAKAKKAADKKAADEKAAAKKKADEDAAEKAAQEEQASEEAGGSDESTGGDEKPEITLEALRDQVMAYAKENGNVQGKRLVQEIGGAEKISNVPEDKWLELYKAAGGEV